MVASKFKIVADSSSDVRSLPDIAYAVAPLKIITDVNEYVDDENLDVWGMTNDLLAYEGASSTSCPSVGDWMKAFEGAQYVFCVTITSGLSGSYESACIAKAEFEKANPGSKVFIVDSLSAGSELKLIIEKLCELIAENLTYDAIKKRILEYRDSLGTLFVLESIKNLANNGRVSPLVAKITGVLGIRVIGRASDVGTIEVVGKSRGEKKAISDVFSRMKSEGMKADGKICISHVFNEEAALKLKEKIRSEFANAKVDVYQSCGLCGFYAEKGGLIVGFER